MTHPRLSENCSCAFLFPCHFERSEKTTFDEVNLLAQVDTFRCFTPFSMTVGEVPKVFGQAPPSIAGEKPSSLTEKQQPTDERSMGRVSSTARILCHARRRKRILNRLAIDCIYALSKEELSKVDRELEGIVGDFSLLHKRLKR